MALALTLGLAGCAATSQGLRGSDGKERLVRLQFRLTDETLNVDRLVNYSDINNGPIHIWVFHEPDGAVQRVRVTGHASAEICQQASKALLDVARHPEAVEGFLGFGVADLLPAGSPTAFQEQVGPLLDKLKALATAAGEQVVVHDLHVRADESFVTERPPFRLQRGRAALLSAQPDTHGPAFVPVRRWSPGHAAEPLHFQVTLDELGVSDARLKRLAGDVGLAPWIEEIEILQQRLRWVGEVRSMPASTWSVFDDGVWAYTLHQYRVHAGSRASAGIPLRVAAAQARLRRLLLKYKVVAIATQFENRSQDRVLQLNRAVAENQICLTEPEGCTLTEAEFDEGHQNQVTRTLTTLIAQIRDMPDARWRQLADRIQQDLDARLLEVEQIRQHTLPNQLRAARERLVDGLLRGWPLPTSTQEDAQAIDALLRRQIPRAWQAILQRVSAQDEARLQEESRVSGSLQRANVFFRVKETAPGSYTVSPYYVVSGPYAEVWDADRRLVLIETPYAAPLKTR